MPVEHGAFSSLTVTPLDADGQPNGAPGIEVPGGTFTLHTTEGAVQVGLDPSAPPPPPPVRLGNWPPPARERELVLHQYLGHIEIEVDATRFLDAVNRVNATMTEMIQACDQIQPSIHRASEAFRQMEQANRTEDEVREEFDPGGWVGRDWNGAPTLQPPVRSPLGAAEDPNRWTAPLADSMHWTAPETDEEVPRWLA